jgi:hypothetical protein
VQAMGNQIQRQQETFQQMMQESMCSYMQLLNTLHLPVAEQPQEGQQAFEQAFQQQQSLAAYMERLRPSR